MLHMRSASACAPPRKLCAHPVPARHVGGAREVKRACSAVLQTTRLVSDARTMSAAGKLRVAERSSLQQRGLRHGVQYAARGAERSREGRERGHAYRNNLLFWQRVTIRTDAPNRAKYVGRSAEECEGCQWEVRGNR